MEIMKVLEIIKGLIYGGARLKIPRVPVPVPVQFRPRAPRK
jgi:hypothetical protein